jgi:hypothetical protein
MGLLHALKKFFGTAPLILRYGDLERGRAIVDGEVRVGDGEPLRSPIKGKPCVGFVYTAAHEVSSRSTQKMMRPLRSAEVFRGFGLEMDGGRIEAVPQHPGKFSQADHQALASASYAGFRAAEEVIPTRAKVRLHGVLRKKGDAWTLEFHRLVVLSDESRARKKR